MTLMTELVPCVMTATDGEQQRGGADVGTSAISWYYTETMTLQTCMAAASFRRTATSQKFQRVSLPDEMDLGLKRHCDVDGMNEIIYRHGDETRRSFGGGDIPRTC
jgi:hypothetical protein